MPIRTYCIFHCNLKTQSESTAVTTCIIFQSTLCLLSDIHTHSYADDTGESITVRGCALDSGTLTTDTEIIRMSHCGKFYYDDR